ncbi:hypothetical protein [Blastococcus mobilis]|uniref:Uncharacterized protein n=1 Tax=Blastococcus mobilis TaxID=1938746 RepID=A0A238Y7P1_9ACTN|nr:hypothetical protein [Blastococcus mobilis]SNR66848.1 hypothetical protein SAMN06272737_11845 [Blastococcus mobilis]
MAKEDDDYWKGEVTKARRTQLDVVRKSATGWSALFAAVLGVFGSVTFVGGLTGVDELPESLAGDVRVAIVVAAGLALLATVLAGLAANSLPSVTSDLTFQKLRDDTKNKATSARRLLRWALLCAAGAAVIVTVGSAVVVLSEKEQDAVTAPSAVVVVDGKAVCGPLTEDADGQLSVDGIALGDAGASFTVVSSCP